MGESVETVRLKFIWEDSGAVRRTRELKAEISGLDKVFGNFQTKILSVGGAWIAYRAITGATRHTLDFAKSLIETNASLEYMHRQLAVVLHSSNLAERALKKLSEITITTPFQIEELTQATLTLESFGINSEKYLGFITDWAAGIKESVAETAVNFGKVAIGSKQLSLILSTRQIRLDEFRREMQKTGNAAEALSNIIKLRWGGMAKEMSNTFTGIISNIKDMMFFISAELGKPIFEQIKLDAKAFYEHLRILRDSQVLQDIAFLLGEIYKVWRNITTLTIGGEVGGLKWLFEKGGTKDWIADWKKAFEVLLGGTKEPAVIKQLKDAITFLEVLAKRAGELEKADEKEALLEAKAIVNQFEAYQMGLRGIDSLTESSALKQLKSLDNTNFTLEARIDLEQQILRIQSLHNKYLDKQFEITEATANRMKWMRFEEERRLILQQQRQFGQIGGTRGEEKGVGFGGIQADFGHFTTESQKRLFDRLSEVRERLAGWKEDFKVLVIDTFVEFGDAFGQMAANIISGSKSVEDALKRFLRNVLDQLIAFFASLAALKFLGFLANLIPGFGQFIGMGTNVVGTAWKGLEMPLAMPKTSLPSATPSASSVNIIFQSPVYGMDDFEARIDQATKKLSRLRV